MGRPGRRAAEYIIMALIAHMVSEPSRAFAEPLNRPGDPVVLTGAKVPSLVGIAPQDLVAWRYAGSWQQVPVQVDERAVVDVGTAYNSDPVGLAIPTYTDAKTFTGPDPNPALDDDDEIVFMAKDAGNKPPAFSEPPGVVHNTGVEVRVTDPLSPANTGYIYLFAQTGSLDPSAGKQYVTYQFQLLSGDYRSTYKLKGGGNPENSTITTLSYAHHFSDRWIDDELRVYAGSSTGVDILDRHKVLYVPGVCSRSEETFSEAEGAFIVNKNGPVRAIRSYLGANSGPYTQREHHFYEQRHDIITTLRVHSIPAIVDFFDYSPAASGMRYYNNLNTSGVTIDGVPDAVAEGSVGWELVTGAQGSIAMSFTVDADIPGLIDSSYYLDDSTPSVTQCTGDPYAYGSSGIFAGPLLCTDPTRPECSTITYHLSGTRVIYYEGPGMTVSDAENRYLFATNPLTSATSPWRNATAVAEEDRIPKDFFLYQNYPNPFNPTTTVKYQIPSTSRVSLKVFDILGREVATLVDGVQGAGAYAVRFDATNLPSGVYSYRITVGNLTSNRKMLLIE